MGSGRGKQTRIQKFGVRIKTRIWRGGGAAWGSKNMYEAKAMSRIPFLAQRQINLIFRIPYQSLMKFLLTSRSHPKHKLETLRAVFDK